MFFQTPHGPVVVIVVVVAVVLVVAAVVVVVVVAAIVVVVAAVVAVTVVEVVVVVVVVVAVVVVVEELFFHPLSHLHSLMRNQESYHFRSMTPLFMPNFYPKLFFDDALGVLRSVRGKILMTPMTSLAA